MHKIMIILLLLKLGFVLGHFKTMQPKFFDEAITSSYPLILFKVKGARNNNNNTRLNTEFRTNILM